ncbi:MAG: flavin reductase [Actinophytocola sp.]|nr:flavin reductase [Actinophytocola sp.]
MDTRSLRRCLGRFATGVTVVTYRMATEARGATVNAFTSVSLDPPLVLVSLARSTRACSALDGREFAVNVLRADQRDVALRFAGRHDSSLRIDWDPAGPGEVPTLADAIAVIRCLPWRRYDGGDHVLQLGEVVTVETRDGDPLIFGDGSFTTPGSPLLDGSLAARTRRPAIPAWAEAAYRVHSYAEAS